MSIHDPIADALTIIRNGCMAKKNTVTLRYSTKIENILEILKKEGYIVDFNKSEVKDKKYFCINVELKYHEGKPVIEGLKRISSPGLRVYNGMDSIPEVKNGFGVAVVSTSRGVMSGRDAIKGKVGGEVLCYVW